MSSIDCAIGDSSEGDQKLPALDCPNACESFCKGETRIRPPQRISKKSFAEGITSELCGVIILERKAQSRLPQISLARAVKEKLGQGLEDGIALS